MSIKRYFLIIPILFTMLLLRTQIVYATENDQLPAGNQAEQQEQKQEEEKKQENPGQEEQSQEQQKQEQQNQQNQQQQDQQQQEQQEEPKQEEEQAASAPKTATRTGRTTKAATSKSSTGTGSAASQSSTGSSSSATQSSTGAGTAAAQSSAETGTAAAELSSEADPAEKIVDEEAGGQEQEDQAEGTDLTVQSGKYTLELLSNANIRKKPSISSESLIVAPFGIKLSSDERATNEAGEIWYKLTYGGATGYIREDILEVTEEQNEEGTPEENGEEENSEGAMGEGDVEAEVTKETSTVPLSIPKAVSSIGEESGEVEIAAASSGSVEESQLQNTQTKRIRKMDAIFFMFMGLAIIGSFLTFFAFKLTRSEYFRIKKSLAKESMD